MAATFDGVRAKIQRAEQHFDESQLAVRAGITGTGTQVKLLSIEEVPEGRRVTGSVTPGNPPPGVGIHLGDAIHNLRSALDHSVCQLAVAAGNACECDRTQFPIYEQDTPDHRRRIDRWIRPICPTAQDGIRALQPYQRRPQDPTGDLLWMLSGLDNIDKHRLLLVASPKFATLHLKITIDDETRSFTVSNNPEWRPLKLGAEPLRFRYVVPWDNTKPKTEVKVDAEPLVGVVFDQTGLKCDGAEIAPLFRDMVTDVKSIVDDLARFL